jgi:hypothetical protein
MRDHEGLVQSRGGALGVELGSSLSAGDGFLANLDAITVEDLCAIAIAEGILEGRAGA